MLVTIHQPDFIPWLGFFDRWKKSDLYIVLDDVQFLRRGWHHRDKIKGREGAKWLTVPVLKKGEYNQLINEVKIFNDHKWRTRHLRIINENYSHARNFDYYFNKIKYIYDKRQDLLIDLNMDLLRFFANEFEICTPIVFASQYGIASQATERLVDLVRVVGGTDYLTGHGSRNYLDETKFRQYGINVAWQEYEPPIYKQLQGKFIPRLSCLDYVMNCEPDYLRSLRGT